MNNFFNILLSQKRNTNSIWEGLLSYWSMDQVGNNVVFDTKNINHLYKSATDSSTGKNGNGMYFTSLQYLSGYTSNVMDFDINQPFSISLWVYGMNNTGVKVFISKTFGAVGARLGYEFWVNAGRLCFYIFNESNSKTMATYGNSTQFTSTSNVWRHCVVTYNGTNHTKGIVIYFNGSAISLYRNGGFGLNSINNNANLNIGHSSYSDYGAAACTMDEVCFWNRALTASEVSGLYNSSNGLFW